MLLGNSAFGDIQIALQVTRLAPNGHINAVFQCVEFGKHNHTQRSVLITHRGIHEDHRSGSKGICEVRHRGGDCHGVSQTSDSHSGQIPPVLCIARGIGGQLWQQCWRPQVHLGGSAALKFSDQQIRGGAGGSAHHMQVHSVFGAVGTKTFAVHHHVGAARYRSFESSEVSAVHSQTSGDIYLAKCVTITSHVGGNFQHTRRERGSTYGEVATRFGAVGVVLQHSALETAHKQT
mmetsp:Transcript_54514/g.95236  ORF Transcript_54514/g.95236 Transcript_54514/m.95236 type:complete len:234 (-) Transcript_54514:3955-4656(-)